MILNDVVTIYFSKNRPSQLDLCLTTNQKFCKDLTVNKEFVIYKTTNRKYKKAYEQVSKEHPMVEFVEQTFFRDNILACIKKANNVLFVVDDNIFVREYSTEEICAALAEKPLALGCSLRLGKNTVECYPTKSKNDMPALEKLLINSTSDLRIFNWHIMSIGDFAYPLEVSSSLYRVKDILPILKGCAYTSPNSLEWMMYINIPNYVSLSQLLCYEISVAFADPLNKVQKENNNRAGKNLDYSPEALLKSYEKGLRIDPKPFYHFVSTGAHQEVPIKFYKE